MNYEALRNDWVKYFKYDTFFPSKTIEKNMSKASTVSKLVNIRTSLQQDFGFPAEYGHGVDLKAELPRQRAAGQYVLVRTLLHVIESNELAPRFSKSAFKTKLTQLMASKFTAGASPEMEKGFTELAMQLFVEEG